ncbi:MAG: hypothetical protein ABI353_06690 [Isosphaeraceae bacterium]
MTLAMAAPAWVEAGQITEGFEGSSYDFYSDPGSAASLSTAVKHNGLQSAMLSIANTDQYARVKLDISSSNLTLGQITSASYFVKRTVGGPEEAPYIIFSIAAPGLGSDDTLAVMYNYPAIVTGANWAEINVNANSQLFHVEGATPGLTNQSSITLSQISASEYSPGVSWGSLKVDFVRFGLGLASAGGGPTTAYVDDMTINYNDLQAVPEPATLISAGIAVVIGLGLGFARRRRAKPAA